MKIIANDNGKNLKIDVYKTLNDIPYTLNYHVLKIKEEIETIIKILQQYESFKEVFNNEKFNIQNYINEFLNGIQSQAISIYKENKIASKEINKNPDLRVIPEEVIQPKQDYDVTEVKEKVFNLVPRQTNQSPVLGSKGMSIIKPKPINSNNNSININRDPVTAADLYDIQYQEDLRRAEQEEREQRNHY
jgi:hypothetical protein